MIERESAYSAIENLVTKFKNMPAAQRKGLNEMETRLGYILPMFKALGWDINDIDEVSPETKVSRGWVDFAFRINHIPKFFLETKRVKEDLNASRWVSQAIDYAWTKSVTWALLSDFEGLRVFNAEWRDHNPFSAQFFELDLDSYLTNFDRLWWLSKPAILQRTLDLEAEKVGKKTKRLPVSQNLFRDLKRWRENLFKNYRAFNERYTTAQIDEAVLRLLNRLIFIRTAEDRNVEDVLLLPLVRELKGTKEFNHLDRHLAALFRQLDGRYNSQLFARHFSENLIIPPTDLETVIEGLYEKDFIFYNFNLLDADVLGKVYEQYLGHVVAEREGETHVQEKLTKRKSQGIYYTPTFVTKYITQQTVGRHLTENGYQDSKPLRVLDLSAGSSAFLVQCFDVIDGYLARQLDHTSKEGFDIQDRDRQFGVLENCIYGVDKDKQAVEVARLNLLLRALHSHAKMPMLDHIVHDDSLRSGIFEERFPEVMAEGGFDVIVSNPPYIRAENMPRAERDYYMAGDFKTAYGRFDIFILFVERAIKLLKDGGRLGFIIPYAGFTQNYGLLLRKFILDTCVIEKIVDLSHYKVFADASVATCILILRKESSLEKRLQNRISIIRQATYQDGIIGSGSPIVQSVFFQTPNNMFRLNLDNDIIRLAEKIDASSLTLGQLCYAITGVVAHDSKTGASKDRLIHIRKSNENFKPYIEAKEFQGRYSSLNPSRYIEYRPSEMHRPKFPELFESPKVLIPDIIGNGALSATIDKEGIYTNHSFNCCVPKAYLVDLDRALDITQGDADLSRDYSIEYLLGLVNSRLMSFYFTNILGGGMHASPSNIRRLPIRRIDPESHAEQAAHDEIVSLVEKMLSLQKERDAVRPEDDLDQARALDRQIHHVDHEIDLCVYRLYGLTVEEIDLVEEGPELILAS